MLTSHAISRMAPQHSSTPRPQAAFEREGDQNLHAEQAITRLNDAREALRQGTPSRAELQVGCALRKMKAQGLAWWACSPSARNGDMLISAPSDSPKNQSYEKDNA